jgi:hypothetical protein
VSLERGPLSLVSTIEQLLERKSSGSGLGTENTAIGIRFVDHVTLSNRKVLALTSQTSGGLWRTQATELVYIYIYIYIYI